MINNYYLTSIIIWTLSCKPNDTNINIKIERRFAFASVLNVNLQLLEGLVKSQEGGGGRRRPLDGRSDDQTELRSGPGRVRSPLLRGRQRALQSQEDEAGNPRFRNCSCSQLYKILFDLYFCFSRKWFSISCWRTELLQTSVRQRPKTWRSEAGKKISWQTS